MFTHVLRGGNFLRPRNEVNVISATVPKLLTPGVIAEELGTPLHRVQHILRTRPHIQPHARAGVLRLYSHDAIEIVRLELDAIEGRHKKGSNQQCSTANNY